MNDLFPPFPELLIAAWHLVVNWACFIAACYYGTLLYNKRIIKDLHVVSWFGGFLGFSLIYIVECFFHIPLRFLPFGDAIPWERYPLIEIIALGFLLMSGVSYLIYRFRNCGNQ